MGYIEGLNLDDVEAWGGDNQGGYDPPSQGDYRFRVKESRQDKSSNGFPMLVTELEIVAAADGRATDQDGKTLRDWRSLQPKKGCRMRLKALLDAAGVETTGSGFNTEDLEGAEFVATVIHETRTKQMPDGTERTFDNNPKIIRERRV